MRLHFSPDKLYGREQELAELARIYQELVGKQTSPRLVLIEGWSGNGKTTLANHFGHHQQQQQHQQDDTSRKGISPRFIKGKFDEQNPKPYSGFAQAFHSVLSHLIRNRSDDTQQQVIIEAIRKAVGTDASMINEIVTNLDELLSCGSSSGPTDEEEKGNLTKRNEDRGPFSSGRHTSMNNNNNNNNNSHNNSTSTRMLEKMNQFRFRFKSFVRAISSTQPLILFLDDLQWADMSSLELLKTLACDGACRNLLILGAYRGHEVDQHHHPLAFTIGQLQKVNDMSSSSSTNTGIMSQLVLSDLSHDDLNQFLADSLDLAPEKTASLTQVVMKKTNGNVFHSKEFLNHLVDKKLIQYDMTFYQWTWEADEIAGATDLSDNVVELVASRIRQLPSSAIQILKIASCLWYSFDVPVLERIVVHAQDRLREMSKEHVNNNGRRLSLEESGEMGTGFRVDREDQARITKGLKLAAEQGLLDHVGTNGFKFAHDRIREAAYSLIGPGEEQDHIHMILGQLLFCMYHSDKSQQWMLFSAVDQLNKVSCHLGDARLGLELAEVNLEAADCAIAVSAFLPAAQFLKCGIKLLGDKPWDQNYWLCLTLHSKLASLESSVGRIDETEKAIQKTLYHAKYFEDKLPVYATQIESLGIQGKLREAMALAFEVLVGLGESFPQKMTGKLFKLLVQRDNAKTRQMLRHHTDASILALPRLQDKRKQFVLKILNLITDPTFHLGEMNMLYLIINRMVRISLEDGLGDVSGVAFALYGFSLKSTDGNMKQNYRFGKLAVLLQEQLGTREWDCRVLTFVYVLLNHWQEPLHKSLDPLLAGHNIGMETGDLDYAFQSAGAYLTLYWYSGNALKTGVEDMRKFLAQMKEYKQEKALRIYSPLLQCMLNMSGESQDPVVLTGEAVSQKDYNEQKFTNGIIMSYQLQLAYYFGNMQLAEEMSAKLQQMGTAFNAHYLYVVRKFFFGLIALRVAFDGSGTKQRKNIAVAKRVIKEMEQWTRHGGLNCLHKVLILRAELKAFDFIHRGYRFSRKAPIESVGGAYDIAISTSVRSGFCHDAALACERASAFFERSKEDQYWADSYRSRAIDYYKLWGARPKIAQLTFERSKSVKFESSALGDAFMSAFRPSITTKDHERLRVSAVSRQPTSRRCSSGVLLASATGGFSSFKKLDMNSPEGNLSETESVTNREDEEERVDGLKNQYRLNLNHPHP